MVKAYAYTRVSGATQVKKDGLTRQASAIKRYSKANGYEVVQVFREEGVSGTLEERPALATLMVDLEQNGHGIKTVIIEKLDRLARDLMVQEAIVRDFQRHGYQLVSTAEGPDLADDDGTRKLIRQIFGAVAEYDKTMLVAKLRAARDRKRKATGRCEGPLPYGQDEHEQKVVRRIRRMRRKGRDGKPSMTLKLICDTLNSEGIPTRRGKLWTPAQLHYILKRKGA